MISHLNYQIIVSKKTTQILISHTMFLAMVSKVAAEKLIIAFEESAETLTFMPQRNPFLNVEFIFKYKYRNLYFMIDI